MNKLKDIQSEKDIESLVLEFYQRAFADETIGHIFTNVAKLELDVHLPIITSFWSSVLLLKGGYRGNIIKKHIDLNIMHKLEEHHFEAWLKIWENTIDQKFIGPISEEAKARAQTMKVIMLLKIRNSESSRFIV